MGHGLDDILTDSLLEEIVEIRVVRVLLWNDLNRCNEQHD